MSSAIPHPGTPERLAFDLRTYAARDARQAETALQLAQRVELTAFQRSAPGHFTASAMLVSADGGRMLLLLHTKLAKWLQPGGHADGRVDLARVALEEAQEETGLRGLLVDPNIFDVDCHAIPGSAGTPAHQHWDVRFVLRATFDEMPRGNAESRAITWRKVAKVAADRQLEPSIVRLAQKWLRRPATLSS